MDEVQKTEQEIDDVIIEEHEEETNPRATISALREKLKTAVKEKQEYLLGWQKSQADFLNLRKRDEEERKLREQFAGQRVLEDIIPVIDSFEMAKQEKAWSEVSEEWRKGVDSIMNQLLSVLTSHGCKQYGAVGEHFDPKIHEAIQMIPTELPEQDHTIHSVYQKGYTMHDKVIRPAKVAVWGSA